MAKDHPRLKLGKRAAFVKTHLKQLPQEPETWEVDFRVLPKPTDQNETEFLGVAASLPKGDPLVLMVVEYNPNVNDLADLLADAMRRPLTGPARRPQHIHFRNNPRWEELYRHLNDLGIATSIHEELPKVEEVYEDFLREIRKASPGPFFMVSPGRGHVAERFPAVARFVKGYGHIEIGEHEGFGFLVRALDSGGLVFEDNKAETLADALVALEKGLAKWFEEGRIEAKPADRPE
jgi:Domain of unknown function (DUF6930)